MQDAQDKDDEFTIAFKPTFDRGAPHDAQGHVPHRQHDQHVNEKEDGRFVLKVEGEAAVEEFNSLADAVATARKLRRIVELTAFDPVGRVTVKMP